MDNPTTEPGDTQAGVVKFEESAEELAAAVCERHRLTSLHIFFAQSLWRVFGFRKDPKGYEASVESGEGDTIRAAINNLDARLIEGPIHRKRSRDHDGPEPGFA